MKIFQPSTGGGGGGGSPAGATNDIQLNIGGSFGADTGKFTYSAASGLYVENTIIQFSRYAKFGPAVPNNTILSAGTSPGMEFWGTDNTSFGTDVTFGNTSNGANAYVALSLNNDLAASNDFTHFGGMFLNSSGYSDTTFGTAFAVPNLMIIQNTDASIAYAATQNTGAHIFYIGNTNVGGFATVSTANEFARMNITGLGIHTTNPLVGLEVAETSTAAVRGILTGQYSTGTTSSRFILRKARGSLTSPTTVVTGDNLGALVFEGYDGTNYLQMGNIIVNAEGTIGTGRVPTNMRFQTATDAATSVLTTAMSINSAQLVTVGVVGTSLGKIAFAGSTSTSITLQGQAVGSSSVLTLPTGTDTLVGKATTDTLTNKTLTDAQVTVTAPQTLSEGYLGIPQNSQSAAYTTVMADSGKHILHPTADNNARTFTIAANASVAYPIGTTLTFINQINTVTIAITSDTLTFAGTGTTGSRTLAANGMATAVKVASTVWFINGVGLT